MVELRINVMSSVECIVVDIEEGKFSYPAIVKDPKQLPSIAHLYDSTYLSTLYSYLPIKNIQTHLLSNTRLAFSPNTVYLRDLGKSILTCGKPIELPKDSKLSTSTNVNIIEESFVTQLVEKEYRKHRQILKYLHTLQQQNSIEFMNLFIGKEFIPYKTTPRMPTRSAASVIKWNMKVTDNPIEKLNERFTEEREILDQILFAKVII